MVPSLVWSALGFALLVMIVIAAVVLLMPRVPIRYRVARRIVPCPADGRMALVDYIVQGEGTEVAVDVLRCSHRPGEVPVMCGRECRSASVAPFARRAAAG
jgi:hypothetical protein